MVYRAVPGSDSTATTPMTPAAEDPRRDVLTGAFTQAAYLTDQPRYAALASADAPACLVFIDVDHFKNVNDRDASHGLGNAVLKEFGRRLLTISAGKGEVYRYAGDEFVIILPNHSTDEGVPIAERVRAALADTPMEGLHITASIGVATIPEHATTAKDWEDRADKAMFEAKRLHRNLVRVFGEPPPKAEEPRKLARKEAPPADLLTEDDKDGMRKQLILGQPVYCPRDQMPLAAHRVDSMSHVGANYIVMCPGCGYSTRLDSAEI